MCNTIVTKYPKTRNWLKWYLEPNRAIILFNACKAKSKYNKNIIQDTNAQENVNR